VANLSSADGSFSNLCPPLWIRGLLFGFADSSAPKQILSNYLTLNNIATDSTVYRHEIPNTGEGGRTNNHKYFL
jgi:hypothetical protein